MTDQNQQNQNQSQSQSMQGNQAGSGLAQSPKKSQNKKVGVAVILLGLFVLGVFSAPSIISALDNDEEDKPKETEVISKREYKPPVEVKNPEVKKFTFDDTETEEPPIERLGESSTQPQVADTAPPKLVKSLTGDMMNKSGAMGSIDSNDSADKDIEDQEAVNNAIAQANSYLAQSGSGEEPKEKLENKQDDIFSAPTFTATTARKSQYNPNLLLEQGTLIPCALRVKVISNVSGQLSCTITENVFSSNGNVLLIDKGSRVNGYYQGGSVQHGANQLFVVWQEVRTPDHLVIPLNSGSTDELGANGLNGWVDNHFWERFSNAIFLSMILDGNNILLSKMSDSTARNSQETREASKEIATTVLEQMGDIKPTLYKNQGDKIGIFVARDVDFSGVYKLKRSR